jgi:hypothetical protein
MSRGGRPSIDCVEFESVECIFARVVSKWLELPLPAERTFQRPTGSIRTC